VKATVLPDLNSSVTCQMASAAGDETGRVAVGAEKSDPIVFIGIARGSRGQTRRRSISWHLVGRVLRSNFDLASNDSCQPAASTLDGRQPQPRVMRFKERGGRRRTSSLGRGGCLNRPFNLLNGEFVKGRSPGRYDVEPSGAGRTSKLDAAEFDQLRMKPLRTAKRASDLSSLVIGDSQLVATAGTRKYCQRFAPSTGKAGIGELLKAL
jgi:hypothetical protein